jgi:hypothetical protein
MDDERKRMDNFPGMDRMQKSRHNLPAFEFENNINSNLFLPIPIPVLKENQLALR